MKSSFSRHVYRIAFNMLVDSHIQTFKFKGFRDPTCGGRVHEGRGRNNRTKWHPFNNFLLNVTAQNSTQEYVTNIIIKIERNALYFVLSRPKFLEYVSQVTDWVVKCLNIALLIHIGTGNWSYICIGQWYPVMKSGAAIVVWAIPTLLQLHTMHVFVPTYRLCKYSFLIIWCVRMSSYTIAT